MRRYVWDDSKNERLKEQRGVSFEEVVFCIENGGVLDVIEHPSDRYPGQNIYVIQIGDYVYMVPFIKKESLAVLKTIIPSRKLTKKYLKKGARHEKNQT